MHKFHLRAHFVVEADHNDEFYGFKWLGCKLTIGVHGFAFF
jgi:hypothetical protein